MANNISQSTHIIDTGTTDMVVTTTIGIKSVRWVSPAATADDQAIIQNAAGRVIWESCAPGANYVEQSPIEEAAGGGYKVPTLDSGTLYIKTVHVGALDKEDN